MGVMPGGACYTDTCLDEADLIQMPPQTPRASGPAQHPSQSMLQKESSGATRGPKTGKAALLGIAAASNLELSPGMLYKGSDPAAYAASPIADSNSLDVLSHTAGGGAF